MSQNEIAKCKCGVGVDRTPKAKCARCNCPYGCHGFHDLIVPDEIWCAISPVGDSGGLLCPTCIIAALGEAGFKEVPLYFASGPAKLSLTIEAKQYCDLWQKAKIKLEEVANTQQSWILCSARMPTEEDGDKHGNVLWLIYDEFRKSEFKLVGLWGSIFLAHLIQKAWTHLPPDPEEPRK